MMAAKQKESTKNNTALNAGRRRSTRNAAKQEDKISTSIKQEVEDSPRKANTSAKRAAPDRDRSSKRVKIELTPSQHKKQQSKEDVNSLSSPDETESGSELSDVPDNDDADMDVDAKDELKEELPSAEEDESDFSEKETQKSSNPKSRSNAKPTLKKANTNPTKSSLKVKSEDKSPTKTKAPADKASALRAKKLKAFNEFANTSPFPDFPHPTHEEAHLAHKILASLHGDRIRPEKVVARSDQAGCGDSPSVLDALVRTILSQNTSDKNSTRAKISMDKVYGGSDSWEAIAAGGREKLQEAIKSGGLSVVKSKVIIGLLEQVHAKYGKYSLDHMFEKTNDEAMEELISFQGVGPKTASCVLMFCLQRDSFAVDTHVYRIAGLLGWRPMSADREQCQAHLEARVPDEDKYGLHILLVGHGKKCDECKAGGKSLGKCELRKAFRKGKLRGEAGEEVKGEEEEAVKVESIEGLEEGEGNVKKEEDDESVKKEEEQDWESGQEDYVHGMEGTKSKKASTNSKGPKELKGEKAKPPKKSKA